MNGLYRGRTVRSAYIFYSTFSGKGQLNLIRKYSSHNYNLHQYHKKGYQNKNMVNCFQAFYVTKGHISFAALLSNSPSIILASPEVIVTRR